MRAVAEHGKSGTYINHRCRCAPCRDAHSATMRAQRRQRYAQRTLVHGRWVAPDYVAHGTANTYTNWGCRCADCTEGQRVTKWFERRARAARSAGGGPQ